MAVDTKRGAMPDPEIQIGYIARDGRCVCDLCLRMRRITAFSPLNLIQHMLKEHSPGLHVVTTADKAVLEACEALSHSDLLDARDDGRPKWNRFAHAELARRGAK